MVEVWYDTALAAQSVAFFCLKAGKPLSRRMVLALVYAADRISLERHGFPVVDDIYVATDFGPAGRQLAALLVGDAPAFGSIIVSEDTVEGTRLAFGDLDHLSIALEKVLEDTWMQFGNMDENDMLHWMVEHLGEWPAGCKAGHEIGLEDIFKAFGDSDCIEAVRQIHEFRGIAEIFARARVA